MQTGISLTVGQTATVDVILRVASVGESVVVTGEAPVVEPTRSETSQVIDAVQIQGLPTNGRQFVDYALLTPGVATGRTSIQSTFTETEVTRISFGGMRDLSNAVTVDGADFVNEATGSQRATPSQEAVSEFRVVNNSFGAEYGRALGDQSLAGTLNTLVRPDLVNTALVQYARRHYNFPAVSGQPNLDIPNTLLFGHNFGTFDAINES